MTGIESIDISHATCLHRLAEYAYEDAPQLFALYGIYNSEHLEFFCGWGMQWPADAGGAIFYDRQDRSTWYGESADAILADHKIFADTRLVWL